VADGVTQPPPYRAAMAVTTNYETRGPSGGDGTTIEVFVARWQRREDANHAMLFAELWAVLSLSAPEPASAAHGTNALLSV